MKWGVVFNKDVFLTIVSMLVLVSMLVNYELTMTMSKRSYTTPKSTISKNNNNNNKINDDALFHKIDLLSRQLSRAHRFERNTTTKRSIAELVDQISQLNKGAQNRQTNREKRPRSSTAIIFNGVKEIIDIEAFLRDVTNPKSSTKDDVADAEEATPTTATIDWRHGTQIILGVTHDGHKKYSKEINKLEQQSEFPFRAIAVPPSESKQLVNTLRYLLQKTESEVVLIARNVRSIGATKNFDIDEFVSPLLSERAGKTSDVVVASQLTPEGWWKTGCYQSKLIWNQYNVQYGTDDIYHHTMVSEKESDEEPRYRVQSDRKWIQCEFFDGPFAMKKRLLLSHLEDMAKNKVIDHLLYTELAFLLRHQGRGGGKMVKLHPSSLFRMQSEKMGGTLQQLTRHNWDAFAKRYSISEISIATEADHGVRMNNRHTHNFDQNTPNIQCPHNEKNAEKVFQQLRACTRGSQALITKMFSMFDQIGLQYASDGNPELTAIKLYDTDHDQEFSVYTQNLTILMKHHTELLRKAGMQIDRTSCKDSVKQSGFCSNSFFLTDGQWRVKLRRVDIVSSKDLYKSSKSFTNNKKHNESEVPNYTKKSHDNEVNSKKYNSFPRSRIFGEPTKMRMGSYWFPSSPNPGYYVRAKYGLEHILKHYTTRVGKGIDMSGTEYCPVNGHQLCMDRFLEDGNIQLQRAWA